jgi:hypothetical protein
MKEYGSKFSYEIVEGEAPAPRPPSPSSSAACLSAEAAREGPSHLQFGGGAAGASY